jgi:hypothetical protein
MGCYETEKKNAVQGIVCCVFGMSSCAHHPVTLLGHSRER